MSSDELKKRAAEAALDTSKIWMWWESAPRLTIRLFYCRPRSDQASTGWRGVEFRSDATQQLKACKIPVLDLNAVGPLSLYIDGADEVTRHLQMIKGGGGALTRGRNYRRRQRAVYLYRRSVQAGRCARRISTAGRSDFRWLAVMLDENCSSAVVSRYCGRTSSPIMAT